MFPQYYRGGAWLTGASWTLWKANVRQREHFSLNYTRYTNIWRHQTLKKRSNTMVWYIRHDNYIILSNIINCLISWFARKDIKKQISLPFSPKQVSKLRWTVGSDSFLYYIEWRMKIVDIYRYYIFRYWFSIACPHRVIQTSPANYCLIHTWEYGSKELTTQEWPSRPVAGPSEQQRSRPVAGPSERQRSSGWSSEQQRSRPLAGPSERRRSSGWSSE